MNKIISIPEGRRLEFKEILPKGIELAKTVIGFSNDAGGEIIVGIKNQPREITGIPEELLFQTEEKISNIISNHCEPIILPEITFLTFEDKTAIRVKIYRGSQVPYYLKSAGKLKGTYVRVGSSNRQASEEMIQELERLRRNISFDSLPVRDVDFKDLDLSKFQSEFEVQTGKKLDYNGLKKIELIKEVNGKNFPTNAALLLCSSKHKQRFFPYAKIECARFKGIKTNEFIDQATIEGTVELQPDEVIHFVQRNISKSGSIQGVYRVDRWEYPMVAIRETVINAIVHRDYSLLGRDIKVAIFDDMLEITSSGTIPASIDFSGDLPVGQSEIRNRVLAPIFKKLGLIEQWGTGFKKIQDALVDYPEIELRINEPGMGFQVQFVKKDYQSKNYSNKITSSGHQIGIKDSANTSQAPSKYRASTEQVPSRYRASNQQVSNKRQVGTKLAPSWHQVGTKLAPS